MEVPPFQPLTKWRERNSMPCASEPGVYILAKFQPEPPLTVDPLAAEVIYIGETCHRLRSRWRFFDKAAFREGGAHSGGQTFAKEFCMDSDWPECPWLYVAALTIELDEPRRCAYIRLVERWLIWQYIQRHGRLPQCNKK